ncbi:MAG: putative polymerase subfamily sigma factor [Acidimicrobiales bacterium]|nr:putative polymerase subfamily sigma factor [Acidimicrobiales bacterium]
MTSTTGSTPATTDEVHDLERARVAAAQAGDRVALEQLLRDHQARIHAVCRRITGNDTDALDATQEALIAVVRGLPRFDGRSRFSTWVYRIATNACLDELRRRRRRPVVGLPEHDGNTVEPADDESVPFDAQVADRLDIDAALAELPADFRAAVVLRDLCRLDYAEIAEVLDIPAGTVRSRIARGRAHLADRLGNQPEPAERPIVTP